MKRDETITLSPAGETRREAMLDELLGEMQAVHVGRRRRRRVVAASGATLLIVLAAFGAWRGLERPAPAPDRVVVDTPPPPITLPDPAPSMIVERVETDRSILDRCRPAATFTAEILDDAALLTALAEIDRPTGLVRVNGETRLTADVADNET